MNNKYEKITHTFEAVFDDNSEILILGSVPSVKSREYGFFYMHKQNRFWKVLSKVFDDDFTVDDIEKKKALLLSHKIALYDVIESCEIIGSSDVSIKNVEPANKVIDKIIKTGKIKVIALNGNKAGELYKKYFKDIDIKTIYLPSTSPANAKMNVDALVKIWQNIR